MGLGPLHRVVGTLAIVAFIATGVFMLTRPAGFFEGHEAMRFRFRANHVYLLMSGLLNVLVGVYVAPCPGGWRRRLQVAGSTILLVAPVTLLLAFILEPHRDTTIRPLTEASIVALFLATMLHIPAGAAIRRSGGA
jgi:hypothetical protein